MEFQHERDLRQGLKVEWDKREKFIDALRALAEFHEHALEREWDRSEKLEAERDKFRDTLEELVDWQNGPPLESRKWLDGWNEAMEKANALLGREEAKP